MMKHRQDRSLTRRALLAQAAGLAGASCVLTAIPTQATEKVIRIVKNGRIKQSICRGCLRKAGMEGDLIATIKKNIQHIGHFHTAGVPGRHELGDNQEIYYPAIMRAIAETGFSGYEAHEYTPIHYPLNSLVQAVETCDV